MIIAENLTKHFLDFVAVNGINLKVDTGQVLALLGPNGAGKTTTVRMLTSILVPTAGRAEVAGFDVVRQAENVRASVGVLTEHHGLYNRMTAEEYLEFFGRLYGMEKSVISQKSKELLGRFGLEPARKKRLGEYSKGMRQKLALVRALIHDPPVLLLDEPTSAMDPESARMVRDSIHTLRSGDRTIVLCTHNLAEAEELADQVAIIQQGDIIMSGTVDGLKRRLLGPAEYEAILAVPLDGKQSWRDHLPVGVRLTQEDSCRLRFQIDQPELNNPSLLALLIADELKVVAYSEIPRSLEQAYLQAVVQENKEAAHA